MQIDGDLKVGQRWWPWRILWPLLLLVVILTACASDSGSEDSIVSQTRRDFCALDEELSMSDADLVAPMQGWADGDVDAAVVAGEFTRAVEREAETLDRWVDAASPEIEDDARLLALYAKRELEGLPHESEMAALLGRLQSGDTAALAQLEGLAAPVAAVGRYGEADAAVAVWVDEHCSG